MDFDKQEAIALHKQLRSHLVAAINTNIKLLEAIDEKPTLVQLLGSITSELHDLLKDGQ